MRRLIRDENGATAVVVAILLALLIGMSALVVDLGDGMWERRMLQNSADAAALAVAIDCAQGDCAEFGTTADTYASDNNFRGAFVSSVVGPDGNDPTPQGGEVTVTTRTGESGGEGRLRQFFSGVLGQEQGLATGASATAVWGAVSMADASIPLTISMCDWEDAAGIVFDVEDLENNNLSNLPTIDELPTGDYYGKTKGATIRFHNAKDDPDGCEAKPGHDGDGDEKLPAGWGWLAESEGCKIKNVGAEEDGSFWGEVDTGNNASSIQCLEDSLGTAVVVPVFIDFKKTNPKDQYRLYAPAAFYLTGYRFPSHEKPSKSLRPCAPPETCISGHFVLKTEAGQVPTGDIDLGINTVALKN
jgi:Flp pilus assembly protein TadG